MSQFLIPEPQGRRVSNSSVQHGLAGTGAAPPGSRSSPRDGNTQLPSGLMAWAGKQVHVCTAANLQMGDFCTFTAQYLGLCKSKRFVVH